MSLLLELTDTSASGREIALSVGGFDVRGQVAMQGAHLHLAGREGTVTADRLIIRDVSVMGHGLRASGQALEAVNATVSWSDNGFRLRAASIAVRAVQVIGDAEPLDGTIELEGIHLSDVAVEEDAVQLRQLRIATVRADSAVPTPSRDDDGRNDAASTSPVLQRLLGVLDRLSGHVNVDLGLDLTVPVIGRRRATHEFRVPVDAGTIDYRRLEDNLSTLEDSLLDFSVRDEGLVLEVGIPFLPTRGKGKPIVVWTLDGSDRDLAHQQRVRLSVLAQPNMNDKDERADQADEKSSPVALRKADVRSLDVKLEVAHAEDSPIRRVGALVVAGDMTYATDESPDGLLRARAENVELGALATGRVSIDGLRLDAAPDVEIALRGATVARARVVAHSVQLDGVRVAPRAAEARDDASRNGAGGEHVHVTHARHTP